MKRKSGIKTLRPAACPKKPFVRNTKRRGEIIEIAFLHKVADMGFAVTKPYGDSEPYDFIVDSGDRLWRVQVKSTARFYKGGYRINAHHSHGRTWTAYTAEQIDILATYIQPLDVWYIIPVSAFTPSESLNFFPQVLASRGRYEPFREAWFLMACRRDGEPREGIVTSPPCSYSPSSGTPCPGCVQK
jgi:hypothetical protein